MANKIYYDIFESDDFAEYHVSAIRSEVVNRDALCKRTPVTNPDKDIRKAIWQREADYYDAEQI